jgi:crotonobetainyl-CoA:carnitine CoA-transferase CaiB-like acyl-CoA transferase
MSNHFQNYFLSGKPPGAQGTKHPVMPLGIYRTRNGYMTVGAMWPRIANVINKEWLLNDPRFDTTEKRLANRKEFDDIVEDAFSHADTEEWLERLQAEGIGAAPINTLDKTVIDPQVVYNGTVIGMNHPVCGPIRAIANPIHLIDSIEGQPDPPPTLGQQTEEVLKGLLGYPEEKIKTIREEGAAHAGELEERMLKI